MYVTFSTFFSSIIVRIVGKSATLTRWAIIKIMFCELPHCCSLGFEVYKVSIFVNVTIEEI